MPKTPAKPGQTPFRRRIPLELRSEEYELLEREEPRFGTKRATLVAGLEALARFAGVEREASEATTACEAAGERAKALADKAVRLERELAKAKAEASEAKKRREAAERKGTKANADTHSEARELASLLAAERDARDRLEEELRDLEAELLDALHCPRCDRWVPPSDWATKEEGDYELVYHRTCGFHRGNLAMATSLLGYRERH